MRRRSHILLTKNLLPYVSTEDIIRVGSRIDKPRNLDMIHANFFGGGRESTDFFDLTTRGGHRKFGHDLESAIMIGYMSDQKHGVDIAIAHLLEDHLSNMMIDVLGIDQKEMLESMMNYSLSQNMKKRRRSRSSNWW